MDEFEYEWAGPFQRRCKERLNVKFLIYKGRCDLKHDHSGNHALERGMEIVEFHTVHEVKLSNFAELLVEKRIREMGLDDI